MVAREHSLWSCVSPRRFRADSGASLRRRKRNKKVAVEFIPICGRNSRGSRKWLTKSSPSVGCGSTLSRAGSSAVAASKTAAASGRGASTIGGGTSAVPAIMPGLSAPWATDDLIEINSTGSTVPTLLNVELGGGREVLDSLRTRYPRNR